MLFSIYAEKSVTVLKNTYIVLSDRRTIQNTNIIHCMPNKIAGKKH